jgi:HK97 family phage portal protein
MLERLTAAFAAGMQVKSGRSMASPRGQFDPIRESFPGAWQRGVTVDSQQCILAFSAVYACVTRIASDIAKLRPRLLEQNADGTWLEALPSSPYWVVLRKPNSYQNRIQFLTDWLLMKLLHGNTYVLKERDGRGIVIAMYVLDSRRVQALVTPDGGVYYRVSSDHLARTEHDVTVPASEIIHDRGPTLWHPLIGVSPIYACGRSATQGTRIQSNSATFFENMSRPSGILTAPGTIDAVTASRLKGEFEKNYGGANIGRLMIGGDGLKYEAMVIPPVDAQLIQQLDWTVADVGRTFGMPLYKIGAGPMPTANNVEALEQQYYSGCLQVLIESLELCLDEGLGLGIGRGVEFDLDGLLRMDTPTLYEALGRAVGGGYMAPNEARRRINLSPTAGGDAPYLQQQNWSLEQLSQRGAAPDTSGAGAEKMAALLATMERAAGALHARAGGRQLAGTSTHAAAPYLTRALASDGGHEQ